jgi:DUF1016 N-terminal domain
MNFDLLTNNILETHTALQQNAIKAVNINLTIRNWLIGFYIVEFEQKGEDRAKYGTKLLAELAKALKAKSIAKINERELRNFRTFYKTYFGLANSIFQSETFSIRGLPTPELSKLIWGLPTQELQVSDNQQNRIYFEKLLTKISYTNFVEIIKIKDENKRKFYELLVIKNTLSVEELKHQIATLAYERVGLSQNNELAFEELNTKILPEKPTDAVKSIYLFDFLGLPNAHLIEESKEILTQFIENELQKNI